ncbi:MAG: peptide/nickel transport system permease protein [Solirubrobacteraceae bacterium]|jgi:peptide/nickel transport system permease protein|nr:peptide/nickel transport system permease protein [Solirubrobacteraceae bacterium]
MTRFVVRRVIAMIAVLFVISIVTFGIFNVIPNGDPAYRLAGRNATPVTLQTIRRTYGFDKPVYVQYVKTMQKVFTGDLVSYANSVNVVDQIVQGFPRTLSLAVGAGVMWMFFAISLGLYTAVKAGRFADRFLTVLALIGISMPVFWVGALMNYYLGFKWGLFPNGGYVEFTKSPLQWAYHLIMPWTALSILFIGFYSRVLRSNVLDTMSDDYVRTARAKGISERRILLRHVLRNSIIPIVTLFGLDFGAVVGGGAILTEVVFDLQGVGQYAAESISQLDIPPVLAITMFGAFFVVMSNTIVDILYAALDPRIRLTS